MVVSLLIIVTILAAAVSLYDGIARVRGRRTNSVLAIVEIIAAALMLVAVFITFPAPLNLFLFALILEIVLILILIFRGAGRKGVGTITIIALVLNTIVVLIASGWLHIPGLG